MSSRYSSHKVNIAMNNDSKYSINDINNAFYNASENSFNKIPFDSLLPDLWSKYGVGQEILEIGSGTGALASWLSKQGYQVFCIEPAEKLAQQARRKGLKVYTTTIQDFKTNHKYDDIIAISSLIHLRKSHLPPQIQKIHNFLKLHGIFFVSFIEGEDEGFEDPTKIGKLRYFSKWNDAELNIIFSPYFTLLESHKIYNEKMDRTFLLRVYLAKKVT